VRIDYLEDTGRYMCEVKLKCVDCGQPFRFMGLPLGLNMNGAAMGLDGLEARLAIMPADRIPHPLQGVTGFGETPAPQNMHSDEWWQAELDRCVGVEQAKYRALFAAALEGVEARRSAKPSDAQEKCWGTTMSYMQSKEQQS
jgi:hypothetical protein